jgi:hypothetical protein
VCVRAYIHMESVHTCMSISVCIVFVKKNITRMRRSYSLYILMVGPFPASYVSESYVYQAALFRTVYFC